MARQRQAYHRQGQRRKPRSALPCAQRADTLAACATRVMWTPDRRLAGRSALRAVHGCRGRGQEIPAGQPEPGIRPASTPTAAIRMAAASRAAGTTARSTRAPSRPAALPQARPCTDQRAAARARARPGVSPPHLARLPPFTRPASSPPGTGQQAGPGRAARAAARSRRQRMPGRSPRRPSTGTPSPTTRSSPCPIRPPTLPPPRPWPSLTTLRRAAGRPGRAGPRAPARGRGPPGRRPARTGRSRIIAGHQRAQAGGRETAPRAARGRPGRGRGGGIRHVFLPDQRPD